MTMIEKMARAICPEGWSETNDSGLSEKDADAHTQIIRRWAYEKAKAALKAMLEPNEAMIRSGEIAGWDEANHMPAINMTETAYRAMIQGALDEKEGQD